jgi:ketosteroid isomerase-like protein
VAQARRALARRRRRRQLAPAPARPPRPLHLRPAARPRLEAERKSLRAAEDALIAGFAAEGPRALLAAAAHDLRYFPPASFPLSGVGPVQTALLTRQDVLTFTPRGDGVSAAGDLGYVYGEATRTTKPGAPTERGGYLRIWRRAEDGRWQLALDLTITAPAEPADERSQGPSDMS